ncbi:hypothetical protein QZH41_010938, partial [Actinostola sp. cb2023]
CLGNRQSFKARQRERIAMSCESKRAAEQRITECQTSQSKRKKKDHTGNINSMNWDKENLKAEVEGYEDGVQVNWSALAKKYGIKTKAGNYAHNGGQIAQQYLVNEEVNVHRFKRKNEEQESKETRIRRKKLRGLGGEISLPTPETNDELRDTLKLKIQKGEYTLGELIVPKKYKKMLIDKDGNIKSEEFTIQGRKIPLDEIRKKTLTKHKPFIRQHPDVYYDEMSRLNVVECLKKKMEFDDTQGLTAMREKLKKMQRQRHLMIWHDHSTVANHGHLVFVVTSAYDPALYLTKEEYYQKTGIWVDIQTEVEKPELYIVGRCKSSDEEQLGYIDTRCECLRGLSQNFEVMAGIPINDVMRFFKGDGPAVAFESGQQKGGHYFCSVCGMHAVMSDTLDHVFRCTHVSLKDKHKEILRGPFGRKHSLLKKPKPLKGLQKEELIGELHARKIYPHPDSTKADLEKELSSQLQGIQRVPALLYCTPMSSFEDHSINTYEALACEPMHDISNHICNVLEELPNHLTKE